MLRKSRRILLTALSLLMAFSLMACTAGDPPTEPIIDNPVVTPAPSDEPATPAEPVEPEPTEPEPVVSADLQPIVFEDVGDLSGVTSLEMARLMGHGINLGNTMEACDSSERIPNREPSVYEQMWGAPITTPEMIAGMAAAGFRTLRVPVAWTNAMDFENGDLTIDPAYLDRVEEIVNYALDQNMFVVMNAHWDHGWWSMFGHPEQERRDFAEEMFVAMWTQISDRFEDYDHRLVFEPANEEWGGRFNDRTDFSPTGGTLTEDECYELITHLAQVFIDLIRSQGGNNPERFLLVPGFNTDVGKTTDARYVMPVCPVDRIMLKVHYYTPWGFCGDTAGVTVWGTTPEVEEMNNLLGSLTKFTDMGYGVVLAEWGVLDNEGPDKWTFLNNFYDNADLHGYSTLMWDTHRNNSTFDRINLEVRIPEEAAIFHARALQLQTMTTEEIIKAATENMAKTLENSADRPAFVLEADSAQAWIMFNSGTWDMEYSVGDIYRPERSAVGIVATDVEVTGEGTYTVGLDFTGTGAGYADGIAFSALAIANGEILFPGYFMEITEVLINGEPVEMSGKPYTTHDNPSTTRVNLHNQWVDSLPDTARVADGDLSDATWTPFEPFLLTQIFTLEITFDYIAP